MREGGENYLKYLKRGKNRKEGRGNKDFKKVGGRLGQGVGALKRGGGELEHPYELCVNINLNIKNMNLFYILMK